MNKNEREMQRSLPIFIIVWFYLDAIIALAPPIYWIVNDYRIMFIFGMPATLFYFISVAVCIVCSLIAAYLVEEKQGAFES
ncbi:hypothetical protein LCGC14_1247380 [marine sediment metagenome]|uniref:Uncharacterized protein n=1 Tax=marine sediment metagenome TaxID=412755 RepID=A0A0F9NLB2_9ZZZZ